MWFGRSQNTGEPSEQVRWCEKPWGDVLPTQQPAHFVGLKRHALVATAHINPSPCARAHISVPRGAASPGLRSRCWVPLIRLTQLLVQNAAIEKLRLANPTPGSLVSAPTPWVRWVRRSGCAAVPAQCFKLPCPGQKGQWGPPL